MQKCQAKSVGAFFPNISAHSGLKDFREMDDIRIMMYIPRSFYFMVFASIFLIIAFPLHSKEELVFSGQKLKGRLFRTTTVVPVFSGVKKIKLGIIPRNAFVVVRRMEDQHAVLESTIDNISYDGVLIPRVTKKGKRTLSPVNNPALLERRIFRVIRTLKIYDSKGREMGAPYEIGDELIVVEKRGKLLRVQKWVKGRPSLDRAWGLVKNTARSLVPLFSRSNVKEKSKKK